MRKVFALLIPILLLSGCLSSGESPVEIQEPTYTFQESYDNHSHQFWNANPMSVGNNSIIELNESGDLSFILELTAFFHEPLLWTQGFVNYSLIYENETVWSVQDNSSITDYTFNMTNVTGNITIQIQSNGSDSQIDNKPGDYFIARAYFVHKY